MTGEPKYEGQDYAQFWVGPGKRYLDLLERRVVADALGSGGTLVEIGAGFGRLAPSYLDRFRSVHLVEPASNLRAEAKRRTCGRAAVIDGDVYALPFPDRFADAVLMVRVFHHLRAPERALAEIRRILKPGGLFLFSYSNKRNVKRVAQYFLRRHPAKGNPFDPSVESYDHALFGHHPQFVEDLLRAAGLSPVAAYGVGIFDKAVEKMPLLGRVRPSVRLSRAVGGLRLAPTQFLLVRRSAP